MNGMSKVHLYFVAFDMKLMSSILYLLFFSFLINAGDNYFNVSMSFTIIKIIIKY